MIKYLNQTCMIHIHAPSFKGRFTVDCSPPAGMVWWLVEDVLTRRVGRRSRSAWLCGQELALVVWKNLWGLLGEKPGCNSSPIGPTTMIIQIRICIENICLSYYLDWHIKRTFIFKTHFMHQEDFNSKY